MTAPTPSPVATDGPARALTAREGITSFVAGILVPAAIVPAWMFGAHALGFGPPVILLAVPLFALTSASLLFWSLGVRSGTTWAHLGFVTPRRSLWHLLWAAPALIIGAAIVAVTSGQTLGLAPPASSGRGDDFEAVGWATGLLMAVSMAVAIPFVEEVVFRGAIFGWLRTRLGTVLAVLATGTWFGLLHISPAIILYVLPLGIGLTAARAWFGSTWASVALHAFNNTLVTALALAAFA